MPKWVTLDKKVGQTPLACMEAWRATQPAAYQDLPLTYAGRLDPLASGKLLVLIGAECKRKEYYLALDKAYEVTLLFGLASDTGDVLGLVSSSAQPDVSKQKLRSALQQSLGKITLPYPHFSSKTVNGKPLHTWAVEKRLHEITIPEKTAYIYNLKLTDYVTITARQLYQQTQDKIASIPPVTEQRKALGNDFRRAEILAQWDAWYQTVDPQQTYTTARVHCICSSGTYMRSLAGHLGELCGTQALALSIHRSQIGQYRKLGPWGYWSISFDGADNSA